MIVNINVLTAVVEDGVLAERDGGLVIDLQVDGAGLLLFSPLSYARRRANHTPWQAAVAAAMYFASQEDSATTLCFCDCQVMTLLPRKKRTPVVLLRVSMSPARSLSL